MQEFNAADYVLDMIANNPTIFSRNRGTTYKDADGVDRPVVDTVIRRRQPGKRTAYTAIRGGWVKSPTFRHFNNLRAAKAWLAA